MNIDFNELKHFIAVVDYGSFTKAAKNIYVSQSTISKSINKLEKKLKVELLERTTRKVIVTDAGELVYKQGIKILGATKELDILISDFMNLPTGDIKIGVPPLIGTLFFANIAQYFGKLNPGITLELVEWGAKRVESLVEEGQIDVGLVVLPVNNDKFNVLPFVEDEFMLFTHKKHPLANEKIIKIEDLREEDFILFTDEFSLHGLVIDHCKRSGFDPKIAYKSSQWDLITELIIAELGVTLFPKSAYSRMDKDKVSVIPIQSPPTWELAVITKKNSYHSFAVRSLLRFFREDFNVYYDDNIFYFTFSD